MGSSGVPWWGSEVVGHTFHRGQEAFLIASFSVNRRAPTGSGTISSHAQWRLRRHRAWEHYKPGHGPHPACPQPGERSWSPHWVASSTSTTTSPDLDGRDFWQAQGPLPGDQASVPPQDGAWGHQPVAL